MISILSDSCADLNHELLDKYDVHTIPLHVALGENPIAMVWISSPRIYLILLNRQVISLKPQQFPLRK